VQKRDTFSLCPNARRLVDDLHARGSAASQHVVQVVDRKADVMDSGPALRDEARDRGVRVVCLQELDEGLSGAETGYARAIGVVQGDLGQTQYVPEEGEALIEGLDRDSNVGYARATRG